jgi:hypothetical protein
MEGGGRERSWLYTPAPRRAAWQFAWQARPAVLMRTTALGPDVVQAGQCARLLRLVLDAARSLGCCEWPNVSHIIKGGAGWWGASNTCPWLVAGCK